MQSHIRKVYVCLAVTCHLLFWQDEWGLLHASVVTWGWNGYRNKNQHRKLTLEKKIPPLLDYNLRPLNHESGALTTELSPPPNNDLSGTHNVQRCAVVIVRDIQIGTSSMPCFEGVQVIHCCSTVKQTQHKQCISNFRCLDNNSITRNNFKSGCIKFLLHEQPTDFFTLKFKWASLYLCQSRREK